ncbi:Zinc/iron permease [Fomitopsis serialis]|uniref:Zinc/iron permease n=1 Tax=Fomitopsis serialis TaxID=139415 RepID=UPI0020082042|nr:Zinc/iron permease [Neoantrodia serialis]KAH9929194.1 Zinc/iron permease [Neoantrodia serialis]
MLLPVLMANDSALAAQPSLRQLEKMPLTLYRKTLDDSSDEMTSWVETRIWLMLGIFVVSLFASSFPSLSQRLPGVRVPGIVFFIGKHFGTGIIISTAFGHLLQDAYEALLSPAVTQRWAVSKWVGMIVLGSLLLIFLVEYISTSYVDRLQSYASEPPTPCDTPSTSSPTPRRPRSPVLLSSEASVTEGHVADAPLPLAPPESSADVSVPFSVDESTPLSDHSAPAYGTAAHPAARPSMYAHTFPRGKNGGKRQSTIAEASQSIFAGGHHRHEERGSHAEHHGSTKAWQGWFGLGKGREEEHNEEVRSGSAGRKAHDNGAGRPEHVHGNGHPHAQNGHDHGHRHVHSHGHVHMDMERWSPERGSGEESDLDGPDAKVGMRRQVIGILMLEIGIMLHSLVIGLTLAITSGGEFTSLVTAIIFHQLFEGLSLGIRIATLPAAAARDVAGFSLLKPILALSFAVTTPIGIGIGLAVFEPGRSEGAKLTLIRGLMSALSAGMLIYAACVEMLAGDFVLDPHLWRSSIARQTLALVSLLLGCVAMGVVGILGE